MAYHDYFLESLARASHERCLAYRRAMARSSDADAVFSVLDDASEDPSVPLIDFVLLCDYADGILRRFSKRYS